VWKNGYRRLEKQETLRCNWLQAVENTMDFVHTWFLHAYMMSLAKLQKTERATFSTNFLGRPFKRYGFQPMKWGLLKSWEYEGEKAGAGWGNLLVFPTLFRQSDIMSTMHWRVPLDDTSTDIYIVHFEPAKDEKPVDEPDDPPLEMAPAQLRPDGEYALDTFYSQDKMAWETQGIIAARGEEHLGTSDRGIVLYRKLLGEQIQRVRDGHDPIALVRDPRENVLVDLEGWTSERDVRAGARWRGREVAAAKSEKEVFDERHEIYEVPHGTARPPRT
jgi:5,5'-dehydrodivanillate O-demethylase oxygenase subunit